VYSAQRRLKNEPSNYLCRVDPVFCPKCKTVPEGTVNTEEFKKKSSFAEVG
jgi:phage FluMu protein Com